MALRVKPKATPKQPVKPVASSQNRQQKRQQELAKYRPDNIQAQVKRDLDTLDQPTSSQAHHQHQQRLKAEHQAQGQALKYFGLVGLVVIILGLLTLL